MYCTNCGQTRPDDATACPNCGRRVQTFPPPPKIPNYLVQSILVTFCCCLPFGIVAVVYAAQVNGKIDAGDIAGAQAASKNAKTWSWVAFIVGAVVTVGSVLLNFFVAFQHHS
jgi:hypothetical protein